MAKIARSQRQRIPPQPRDEHRLSTMLTRSKPIMVTAVRCTGWRRDANDSNVEVCRLAVTLSHGKSETYTCKVQYAEGEREKILEAVMRSPQSREVRAIAAAALQHRSAVISEAYRKMQKDYGPLPATALVAEDEMPLMLEIVA